MYIFEKPLKNVSNIMCHMLIFVKSKKYLGFNIFPDELFKLLKKPI